MSAIEARLISGSQQWRLDSEPQIMKAGQFVLAVRGASSRTVSLDGRQIRLSTGEEGLLGVDLSRSTGYHRLQVDGETFWFGTEDGKLRLAGIQAMLADLRGIGTGWTGQILFSDGAGIRDPHVLYGWLDANADSAIRTVEAILHRPHSRVVTAKMVQRRAGGGILRAPTLKLLRSAPTQNLDENPNGTLQIGNARYDPLRVVARKRRTTVITIANTRAASILVWLVRLTEEVLATDPASDAMVRCRLWNNRAQTLLSRPLARALTAASRLDDRVAPKQPEEVLERRYRDSHRIATDIRRLFGWSASKTPAARFSYVNYADQIYQAYAASIMASSLNLKQTSPVLGAVPLAFSGGPFDLYYDTKCPPNVLRSWRASSHIPDDSRPDLVLHERNTGRVAILDAKYRLGPDGSASEDSRKDVTAYLGLFGLRTVSILYPGAGDLVQISARGLSIVEVPLRPPTPDLQAAISVILDSLELPPY